MCRCRFSIESPPHGRKHPLPRAATGERRKKRRRSGEDGITALHHGCQPPSINKSRPTSDGNWPLFLPANPSPLCDSSPGESLKISTSIYDFLLVKRVSDYYECITPPVLCYVVLFARPNNERIYIYIRRICFNTSAILFMSANIMRLSRKIITNERVVCTIQLTRSFLFFFFWQERNEGNIEENKRRGNKIKEYVAQLPDENTDSGFTWQIYSIYCVTKTSLPCWILGGTTRWVWKKLKFMRLRGGKK